MNQPISILFYYAYNVSFTGAPRMILHLLTALDSARFTPIFVSQCESPLTDEVRTQGITTLVTAFPAVLDVYNEGILGYGVAGKLQSASALLRYNRQIEAIGRQHNVRGIWARNVKSVLLVGPAARRCSVVNNSILSC